MIKKEGLTIVESRNTTNMADYTTKVDKTKNVNIGAAKGN